MVTVSSFPDAPLHQQIRAFRVTALDTEQALSRRRDNLRTRRLCLVREPGWIGLWSSADERALRSIENTLEIIRRLLRF
jgi:hypothetical protein